MRFRLLPAMGAVAVLVAACGGSSTPTTTHKTSSPKTSSHKSSAPAANTSTGAGVNTSTGAGVNTSTVSQTINSTTTTPSFASVGHCTQLTGVSEQFAKAMASATSGGKFDLSAVVSAYHNLANAAPAAIRADVQVAADAFASYASALSKAGYTIGKVPSATQIADLEQAAKSLDTSKLRNAAKAIEAWAVANCK